jgi:DNA-binding GntR family transcriptional regulator
MAELLAGLDRLAREQSLEAYLEGRWAFHSTAYVASRRMRLVAEVERLFWRGGRYHRLVLSSPERFRRSVRSYHDFLAACRKHDPDRAERVIHDSMRWAVDLVAPSLPSEQELR